MGAVFDTRALSADVRLLRLQSDAFARIKSRVATALQRRMPPQAKRDIGAEYNLAASRIAKGITTTRRSDGIELVGSGRQVGLVSFGARWGGRKTPGAVVEVIRGKGRKTIAGAFIRAPGGRAGATGPQVFQRATINGRRAPRYPLVRVPSVTVAQMLKKDGRRERLDAYAAEVAAKEADRLLALK